MSLKFLSLSEGGGNDGEALFDPDFGTVVVRDANEPVGSHRENSLEITSEQAIALTYRSSANA